MPQEKARLRTAMRDRRREFARSQGSAAGAAIASRFLSIADEVGIRPGIGVAAYWPMEGEADVRPLMADLHRRGAVCLLPVVVGRGRPLAFRRWRPGDDLEDGPLGTRHPRPDAETATPAVLLVPLLAFDRRGYRLGQGGGYYDRTLAGLRAGGAVRAVGIGFSCQEVDGVPHGQTDARLDWVVTEQTAFRTAKP